MEVPASDGHLQCLLSSRVVNHYKNNDNFSLVVNSP